MTESISSLGKRAIQTRLTIPEGEPTKKKLKTNSSKVNCFKKTYIKSNNTDIEINNLCKDNTDSWIMYEERCIPNELILKLKRDLSYYSSECAIKWEQQSMNLGTKEVKLPRYTCFLSKIKNKIYKYSKLENVSTQDIPDSVLELFKFVEDKTNTTYDAVFLNFYRNGSDYIGWHADDETGSETSMIKKSSIASVSIGSTREFQLLHKKHKNCIGRSKKDQNDKKIKGELYSFDLKEGDIIVMGGNMQNYWKHRVKQDKKCIESRINLTFRKFEQE